MSNHATPAPEILVEVAYPAHARWIKTGDSPAGDGWIFARERRSGQTLSFAPGALRPWAPADDAHSN